MLRSTLAPCALGLAGPAEAADPPCDGLGTASHFSMFVTGDVSPRWSEPRGRVAVGGDGESDFP